MLRFFPIKQCQKKKDGEVLNKKPLISIVVVVLLMGVVFLVTKLNYAKYETDVALPNLIETAGSFNTNEEIESVEQDIEVESGYIDERKYEEDNITVTGNVIIDRDEGYLSNPDDTEVVHGGVEFDN